MRSEILNIVRWTRDVNVNDKRVQQTVGLQNNGRAIAQHVLGQLHLFPEAGVTFQRLEVVSRVRRLGIDTCKQNADGQTVTVYDIYLYLRLFATSEHRTYFTLKTTGWVYFRFFFFENITRVLTLLGFDSIL